MRKPASPTARPSTLPTLLAAALVFAAPAARAHFVLQSPTAWANQNALGDPQKSAPCGQSDPGSPATATGVVSAFRPGETITVTVDETVFHPGHYRVVLATSRGELPADPKVTAGDTPCGSTVIVTDPAFPLLVDGALKHTARFSGPQSFEVTLPTDVTCANCTLQVVEFMSDHGLNDPGGCFYHHCADISILPPGGEVVTSAGASSGGATAAGGVTFGGSAAGGAGRANGGAGGVGGVTVGAGGPLGRGGLGASGTVGMGGTVEGGATSNAGCGCRVTRPDPPTFLEIASLIAGLVAVRARRR